MLGPLAGVALLAAMIVAYRGVQLMRAPVAWDRFETQTTSGAAVERRRRSLLAGLAVRLSPTALQLASPQMVDRYRQKLFAAGRPEGLTVEQFLGRKAAFTVVLGTAGLLFAIGGSPVFGLTCGVLGYVFQDLWLRSAVRKRQALLERDLPDFLDVLAITVEAGLGFQSAFARVASAFEGPLGEEIDTTLRQMELGMPRREALTHLRKRNDSEVLDSFVTALLQAEELGAPLSEALRSMAEDLREEWNQRARRLAAQAVPKVSMVVAFTFVPASLLIIVAGLLSTIGTDVTGAGPDL